jgi:hypothetical protein
MEYKELRNLAKQHRPYTHGVVSNDDDHDDGSNQQDPKDCPQYEHAQRLAYILGVRDERDAIFSHKTILIKG